MFIVIKVGRVVEFEELEDAMSDVGLLVWLWYHAECNVVHVKYVFFKSVNIKFFKM
jgi:predicted dienelactone hydrolase